MDQPTLKRLRVIDTLAPKFGGQSNRLQALKVAYVDHQWVARRPGR